MEVDWNTKAKRFLKAELVKRGITHEELAFLLSEIQVRETKASIDSKISRGTFSAAFLFQCLNAIGCKSIDSLIIENDWVEEARVEYQRTKEKKKTA